MSIEAPWTPEQVVALERWQSGFFHPLTCPGCSEDDTLDVTAEALTHRCGYVQRWVPDVCIEFLTPPADPKEQP